MSKDNLQKKPEIYRGYQQSGIRLKEPIDSLLQKPPAPIETPIMEILSRYDMAHGVMLYEEKIVPREVITSCLRELKAIGDKRQTEGDITGMLSILHSGERMLIQKLGMDVGGYIHTGRSSQDLMSVTMRLQLRSGLQVIAESLLAFRSVLHKMVSTHASTVMPTFTHGQPAQPSTLGHQLLGIAYSAEQDFRRLKNVYNIINSSPAGSASGTGSPFDVNRERLAELLGFSSVIPNTWASVSAFDHLWETVAFVNILAGNLGHFAQQLLTWAAPGQELINIADRWCITSSFMPHKQNPLALERIEKMQWELGRYVTTHRHWMPVELPPMLSNAHWGLQVMSGVIDTLQINQEEMQRACITSWGQSPDIAALIVQEAGISWREAHQIVGLLVSYTEEHNIPFSKIDSELINNVASQYGREDVNLNPEKLATVCDPLLSIEKRNILGSPSSDETCLQLKNYQERFDEDQLWLHLQLDQVNSANSSLNSCIEKILETDK